jgi:tRNA G18 (ribose-2'-O)-methylase SpoU
LNLAIFAMPQPNSCSFQQRITLPITVICDNVRDPGNLGSIIRTCAAVGCDRLIAIKGCVDTWDPKVIRSGMGAHFRLPMINDVGWETIINHIPENSKIYLADYKYSLEDKTLLNDDRK